MYRFVYEQLKKWKADKNKKPLVFQGARQVGKTYLITQFGKKEYQDFIYLNFEQDEALSDLFAGNLQVENILKKISLYIGKKIKSDNTLLFFDEIQAAPRVLTSLKYFQEAASEYHIIAAGSLLGVSVAKQGSFPVGKVNFMYMYPMNFMEYLLANGQNLLVEELTTRQEISNFPEPIHNKLIEYYKEYLFVGGMPEVVKTYVQKKDVQEVRKIQNELLAAYRRDFSKYADAKQAVKTLELWQSIPFQLARENKKFKYSDVRKNARAAVYEQTIEWLKGAGLINVAYNISAAKLPLSGYTDYSKFKIYFSDTGLLGAMLNLSSKIIIEPDTFFKQYNGAFIENYVAQELVCADWSLYYWTSKSDAEVDFILEKENKLYPMEVKSGTSLNLKSLQSYALKYNPDILFRVSPRNFITRAKFVNIPLYALTPVLYNWKRNRLKIMNN